VDPYEIPLPPDTEQVGDYHTHADYSQVDKKTGSAIKTGDPAKDDFNSDNFSYQDIRGITADGHGVNGYQGYLRTPSGQFKVYDPATRKTMLSK
jgi:hypothetical protein